MDLLIYFAIGIVFSGVTNGIINIKDPFQNPFPMSVSLIVCSIFWPFLILFGILYGGAKIISWIVEMIGDSL